MKCWVVVCFSVVSIHTCTAVRVNLQGSVSLGKDILKSFSHYVHRSGGLALSRRFGGGLSEPTSIKITEVVKWLVNFTNISGNLESYKGPQFEFIQNYVTTLASTTEDVFTRAVTSEPGENGNKLNIFSDPLKLILEKVQIILVDADFILAKPENRHHWVILIKLLSHQFQVGSTKFVTEKLDGNPKEIDKIKKKLIQKLIVSTVAVETHYLVKLCEDLEVCEKDYKCTTALHHLLGDLKNAENDTVKEFVKAFYEVLPNGLSVFLNADTLYEFQVVLSDLAYAANSRAKEVMTSVFRAVDARLNFLQRKDNISKAYDQQLVNAILADMDTIYYTDKPAYPFDNFLSQFVTWEGTGGKLSGHFRALITEISEKLSSQPPDLIDKLKNEVRAFFDLTLQD